MEQMMSRCPSGVVGRPACFMATMLSAQIKALELAAIADCGSVATSQSQSSDCESSDCELWGLGLGYESLAPPALPI